MSQADSDFDNFGIEGNFDSNPQPAEPAAAVTKAPKVYRRREPDVYTLFLVISFVLLLISVILLFIEVGRFER